jgi:ribosomal protein L7/L12
MSGFDMWIERITSTPWLGAALIGIIALMLFVRRNVGESKVKVMGVPENTAASASAPRLAEASEDSLDLGDIIEITKAFTRLDGGQRKSLLAHIERGNKIEAIKELREISGLGLKEAKDVVDALASRKR